VRVVLVVIAALAFGVPAALACDPHPTLAGMEGQLMCPTCKTPLDQSDAPAANRIRQFVLRRIAVGDNDCQIRDNLAAQFGPEVLAAPPTKGFDLVAWLLPIGGLLGGAVVIGVFAWRWSRGREPAPAPGSPEQNGRATLEPELERRVDEELARFE
jgi:cytochrome c-type biogenesis protein CcmH